MADVSLCGMRNNNETIMKQKTILITGVLGFIFSNFVRKIIDEYPQYRFVGVDKASRAWCLKNMFQHPRYTFYFGDIADTHTMNNIFAIERPDIVINGAAESFVDHSIEDALPFVRSNIMGTQVMIDMTLKYNVERFIQISTDECLGQLQPSDPPWTENSIPKPRNPYAANKYAAEILVYAAHETHGLDYNITRCCNNFAPYQPIRNLIPVAIHAILNNQPVPIHGDGKNMREWIYATDHCDAIMTILEKAPANEIYNVGSGFECTNLEMVEYIGKEIGLIPMISFIKNRKAHDKRYFLDCTKLKQLGWEPEYSFERGLKECVQWYVNNPNYYE